MSKVFRNIILIILSIALGNIFIPSAFADIELKLSSGTITKSEKLTIALVLGEKPPEKILIQLNVRNSGADRKLMNVSCNTSCSSESSDSIFKNINLDSSNTLTFDLEGSDTYFKESVEYEIVTVRGSVTTPREVFQIKNNQPEQLKIAVLPKSEFTEEEFGQLYKELKVQVLGSFKSGKYRVKIGNSGEHPFECSADGNNQCISPALTNLENKDHLAINDNQIQGSGLYSSEKSYTVTVYYDQTGGNIFQEPDRSIYGTATLKIIPKDYRPKQGISAGGEVCDPQDPKKKFEVPDKNTIALQVRKAFGEKMTIADIFILGKKQSEINMEIEKRYTEELNKLPKGVMTAIGCIPTQPRELVNGLIRFLSLGSGGIALLLMIFASLRYITAAGNPENIKKAQDQFMNAFIGLLFILFSTLLLQIIGVDILGLPGFVGKS